jgi:predicted hydrocarbon binding protein
VATIERSGYSFPNNVGLIFLQSLEEVAGRNSASAILNLAGLQTWSESQSPDDMRPGIDFSHWAAITAAMEEMYGPRGGRGLARRTGWAMFLRLLRSLNPLAMASLALLRWLPRRLKLKLGLQTIARFFTHSSDQQSTLIEDGEAFYFRILRCPLCWGRHSEEPICHTALGLLEEAVRWISSEREYVVEEIHCIACGDSACEFLIKPITASR